MPGGQGRKGELKVGDTFCQHVVVRGWGIRRWEERKSKGRRTQLMS